MANRSAIFSGSRPPVEINRGECVICEVPFESVMPSKITCSKECSYQNSLRRRLAVRSQARLDARSGRICGICESEFTPKNSSAMFCSNPCANYASRLRTFFGISAAEYREIRREQNNRCAVCDQEGGLVLDHCHKSGAVRALLCHACNVALGFIKEDAHRAR